jgi:hypothetical protein
MRYLDRVPSVTAKIDYGNRFRNELKGTGETMPKEGESPSVGWRAVYNEMGVSTVAELTVLDVSEMGDHSTETTADTQVPDEEPRNN